MGRVGWVLLLLLLPLGMAQPPDPAIVGDTLRPVLDPTVEQAVPPAEEAAGEDLRTEDVRITVLLDARNVEFQIGQMIMGGGKVQADIDADVHIEFRAIGAERFDAALRAWSGDANMSLNGTFGFPSHRTAITAEEIRVLGGGFLLQAFQDIQAEAARRFLEDTVPEMKVLDMAFVWSNTAPLTWFPQVPTTIPGAPQPPDPERVLTDDPVPPLRDPPLILDATARVQYLNRLSLAGLLQNKFGGDPNETPTTSQLLKEHLIETQFDPVLERSAFQLVSFSQLLSFAVPAGWLVDVQFLLPQGFTVESVTDELALDQQKNGASYHLDGAERSDPASQAGLISVSARGPITAIAMIVVALVGLALRLVIELGVVGASRWHHKRRDADQSRAKA